MGRPISVHEVIAQSAVRTKQGLKLFTKEPVCRTDLDTAEGIFAGNPRAAELDAKFRSKEKLSPEELAELKSFLDANMSRFLHIWLWERAGNKVVRSLI